MFTFPVEKNRTRTYQPSQIPFDNQFDCELPREARDELRGEIPPPRKTDRKPLSPPPPEAKRGRGTAATIIAIIAAVGLLYAISHKSTSSMRTAPAESRAVPTPANQPAIEVRRAIPVEIRRALPLLPRAMPSTFPDPVSNWQTVRFPDGTIVQASLQGELTSSASLPSRGRFLGEEWMTREADGRQTSWIWMTPAGSHFPAWIDP